MAKLAKSAALIRFWYNLTLPLRVGLEVNGAIYFYFIFTIQ